MNLYAVQVGIPGTFSYVKDVLSYKDGVSTSIEIIAAATIISLIIGIIARIMKVKGKDNLIVFFTSLVVKIIYFLIIHLLDMAFEFIEEDFLDTNGIGTLLITYMMMTTFIEGFLYNKILKNKKCNPFIISTICNVISVFVVYFSYLGMLWYINEFIKY